MYCRVLWKAAPDVCACCCCSNAQFPSLQNTSGATKHSGGNKQNHNNKTKTARSKKDEMHVSCLKTAVQAHSHLTYNVLRYATVRWVLSKQSQSGNTLRICTILSEISYNLYFHVTFIAAGRIRSSCLLFLRFLGPTLELLV